MKDEAMSPILILNKISKRYPGVVALDEVDFMVEQGEVRALLGKNGAGKSTLVKILSGAVHPDRGEILIDGKPVRISGPQDAFKNGIYTVYQELSLVPGLTVAENILMGRWPQARYLGLPVIDRKAIHRIAQAALDQLQVQIDLDEIVGRLDVAQQQLIEIAKAISFDPRVLVLDEPTSALASQEVDVLHNVVRRLAGQGRAIIYVTHRLQEIPHVADRVTVLRDGVNVGTIPVGEASPARIANLMIGVEWQRKNWGAVGQVGEVKLAVRHLTRKGALNDISFDIRAGEVLGIAGLLGSGRSELVRAIFGRDSIDSGEIWINGSCIHNPTPQRMKALGVGLTPEDRKRQGLVLGFSVQANLTLACFNRSSIQGILLPQRERGLAGKMIESLAIKAANMEVITQNLSGGNQQKVVIGKWLNTLPSILLLDEPTRGIDIQAKEQIFHLVRNLARQGMAVLFVSSEIEEVLDVSDRILIMNHGRITGDMARDSVDLEGLLGFVMEELPC
jgi:ABC-type sugar transport system ATPase subunit